MGGLKHKSLTDSSLFVEVARGSLQFHDAVILALRSLAYKLPDSLHAYAIIRQMKTKFMLASSRLSRSILVGPVSSNMIEVRP
jgi:hypothetical protein